MAEPSLTISFKNQRPVELLDLTASLQALGQEYVEFVNAGGFDPQAGNVRLYVSELRTSSIIAELKALVDQASFVLEHIDVFAAFVANLNDVIGFFLDRSSPEAKPEITKAAATRIFQIVEPVAKDGGSQLILSVTGDVTAPINVVTVNSADANVIQNRIRRFLGPPLPSQGVFEREVLYLQQVRGDAKSHAGDRGVIETFSRKPVKLEFTNETAKNAVLEQPFPFKMAYLVDGRASTVEGQPALYKIYAVHEAFERP